MPKDLQTIDDLLNSSSDNNQDDESVQSKFAKKQEEIKIKELEKATQQVANSLGVPYINLFGFPISPEALALIDEKRSRDLKIVCFYYDGENLRLGAINPQSDKVKELSKELSAKYFTNAKIYLISEYSLNYALKLYSNLPKVKKPVPGVEIKEEDLEKFKESINDFRSLREIINKVNTTDIITLMLATALKSRASDIHVEAEEKGIIVRLRIDGVLQEAAEIDKEKWKRIISRMKALAKVKINITEKPQDGRFSIFLKNEKIEVRVSFLPTSFGESVVMRLLRSESINLKFEDLGLMPEPLAVLEREIKKPNGMILTTGPTGSGKTTTLYAILNKLNQPGTKIVTLEDPIEYQLEGINQSQINESKGYTFPKGLRSILRQDPDIIMVGEIRDLETAEISIQASLTGHLVLSTLHTNDASGVIPRLLDMGVKPYFLVPSINAVIGQRLVRKLCPYCKVEHKLDEKEKEKVNKILAVLSPKSGIEIPTEISTIYKAGPGCDKCNGLGYRDRVGIYEVFTVDDKIKDLISKETPAFKILKQAIENGMVTMLQDGVLKALKGLTSLEEVYRVIGKFEYIDDLYDIVISQTIGRGIKLSKQDLEEGWKLAMKVNDIKDELDEVPIKDLINIIIATAVRAEAGDIHIEPTEKGVKIRFRIDGILHDFVTLSKDHYLQLLSEIKILAGFPTNVKKATWDGRFAIFLDGEKIDSRISIISGGYGETVVIRILANQAASLDMEKLGMKEYTLKVINKSIKKTKGIIITTGPTGSGKTTTLYSLLNKLNRSDIKIITIEDPIEYHLEGIMQTQIDSEKGYDFVSALRSLMRQNPNVIMVGEIRDIETAHVSIDAANTGHLVLSTIHANSAAGAISRFVSLGVDRQLLAASLECSIGQRLVRRICPYCKKEIKIDVETKSRIEEYLSKLSPKAEVQIPKEFHLFQGKGCNKCNNIGYKGRIGVYETISMTPNMQKVIQGNQVTNYDIEVEALKEGAVLIPQDGVLKALSGETTIEEIFRVIE